ncbi:MAG TPA: transposase [Urbifossiella sp.]|nr:transposase [Urbifossiella sp.]
MISGALGVASRLIGWVVMVLGYHIIFSAYGFWLPNDPRGSWSDFVGSWDLFLAAGKATKTDERRSVAGRSHDREKRLAAKETICRPPVKFDGAQARAIGRGFAKYVEQSGLRVWACSIMPEHVHLVTGPFRVSVEQLVIQLKGAATKQLLDEKLHPFDGQARCWTRGEWKVFLFTDADIDRAIQYVKNNPIKDGKPPQTWSFVTSPISREAQPSAAQRKPRTALPRG